MFTHTSGFAFVVVTTLVPWDRHDSVWRLSGALSGRVEQVRVGVGSAAGARRASVRRHGDQSSHVRDQ